jgi:hypothetical protein
LCTHTLQYGRDGSHLRVDRVDEIVSGYSQFTALASEASNGLSFGAAVPLRSASSAATLSSMSGSTAAASATTGSFGAFSRPPPSSMMTTTTDSSGVIAVPYSGSSSSSQRRRGGYSAEVQAAAQHGQAVAAAVSSSASSGASRAAPAMPQFSMRSNSIGSGSSSDPLSDPVARDALKLLFAKDGNFVQVLLHTGRHNYTGKCLM